jgi:outer membrane protein TolC
MYSPGRCGIAVLLVVLATGGRALADSDEATLFTPDRLLTARQLVDAVLARNPTLPAMQAAWQAAQSRIESAAALDDPLLSYATAPRTARADNEDFGQKLELSQKLPWPGKRQLRGERARHEADAAQQDVETSRLKLSATARSLFADWYFIHEAIRINGINQTLLQEFRRIAEARYSTGQASKQDALRADVEFNLLEHRAIVLERQRRDSLARINTLLNRAPDEPVPLPAKLTEPGPLPGVQALRTRAVQMRPELKALAAHIQASESSIGLARRAFYPDFNLKAGYNSLWTEDDKRFTVGVDINLPLNRSKRRAVADAARAKAMQAQWRLTDEEAVVAGEVQRAYDRVEESRHVLTLYRDRLLPLAEENLSAAKADYQAGSGDFLSLLTTEKNLMQTRLQVGQAMAELHRQLAALQRAVGVLAPLTATAQRRDIP